MTPPSGWQKPLAKLVIGGDGHGKGKAWASVARYDDGYVDELWRLGGSGEGADRDITWGGVGGKGQYDTTKMFRSCGRMVAGRESKGLDKEYEVCANVSGDGRQSD